MKKLLINKKGSGSGRYIEIVSPASSESVAAPTAKKEKYRRGRGIKECHRQIVTEETGINYLPGGSHRELSPEREELDRPLQRGKQKNLVAPIGANQGKSRNSCRQDVGGPR